MEPQPLENIMRMHKILVAVDGSISSKNMTKYAAHLAAVKNALVILLHVHHRVPMTIGGEAAQQVRKALAEESARLLAGFVAIVEAENARCVPMTREGKAANVIIQVQEEEDCDLIALGSRGLTALEGLVVGSTTAAVLHRAACPVLVTRNLRKKYLDNPFFE
ncbi:MAG: universal stress protein [Thermodesulfobacteriota bacterium]